MEPALFFKEENRGALGKPFRCYFFIFIIFSDHFLWGWVQEGRGVWSKCQSVWISAEGFSFFLSGVNLSPPNAGPIGPDMSWLAFTDGQADTFWGSACLLSHSEVPLGFARAGWWPVHVRWDAYHSTWCYICAPLLTWLFLSWCEKAAPPVPWSRRELRLYLTVWKSRKIWQSDHCLSSRRITNPEDSNLLQEWTAAPSLAQVIEGWSDIRGEMRSRQRPYLSEAKWSCKW